MLGSLTFIQLCKTHNVRVVSISDNIDTSDGGKSELILNILLAISQEELRNIRKHKTQPQTWKVS